MSTSPAPATFPLQILRGRRVDEWSKGCQKKSCSASHAPEAGHGCYNSLPPPSFAAAAAAQLHDCSTVVTGGTSFDRSPCRPLHLYRSSQTQTTVSFRPISPRVTSSLQPVEPHASYSPLHPFLFPPNSLRSSFLLLLLLLLLSLLHVQSPFHRCGFPLHFVTAIKRKIQFLRVTTPRLLSVPVSPLPPPSPTHLLSFSFSPSTLSLGPPPQLERHGASSPRQRQAQSRR